MWVVILIIILVIVIYKFGESSGKAIGMCSSRKRYEVEIFSIINHILEGHKDCKIITKPEHILELEFLITEEILFFTFNSVLIIL